MPAPCASCEIVSGRAEAHRILDDGVCLAFLDRRPVFHGHVLLIPHVHAPTLTDLPEGLVQPLFTHAQRLARAVQAGLEAQGTFVAMNNTISQSVPHLHIHIVPRRKGDGLKGFFWPRHPYPSDEAMTETARKIRDALR